jgi:hypothetical protein
VIGTTTVPIFFRFDVRTVSQMRSGLLTRSADADGGDGRDTHDGKLRRAVPWACILIGAQVYRNNNDVVAWFDWILNVYLGTAHVLGKQMDMLSSRNDPFGPPRLTNLIGRHSRCQARASRELLCRLPPKDPSDGLSPAVADASLQLTGACTNGARKPTATMYVSVPHATRQMLNEPAAAGRRDQRAHRRVPAREHAHAGGPGACSAARLLPERAAHTRGAPLALRRPLDGVPGLLNCWPRSRWFV